MIVRMRFAVASGLLVFLIAFPQILSADNLPAPGVRQGISLLGIPTRIDPETDYSKSVNLTVEGPRRLKLPVGTDEWDIRWYRVRTGDYLVEPSTQIVTIDIGSSDTVIYVPPDSIVVAPYRFVLYSIGSKPAVRIESADEEDRQKAALNLASYIDFPEWEDRDFIGFGSLRPAVEYEQELYKTTFTSIPQGAELYLDDTLTGTTPLSLSIPGGKHKLLFRADGREDITRYIRLQGDAKIEVELQPAAADADKRVTYRTLIGPFLPKGDADDQINMLFTDTLEIVLEDDPRLSIVRTELPWKQIGSLSQPDFTLLEDTGADLIITGTFLKQGNQLVVQANLYDIQAESVKSGTFWTGDIGLSIFDAMDDIAAKFMEDVDRVLPDAGRVLITQTETVYGALSDRELRLSRKQIINRRWQEYPDSISVQTGINGMMEEGVSRMSASPFIPIIFDWSRDFSSLWQTAAGLAMGINMERSFNGDTSFPYVDLEASGGGRIMFRSSRTDMAFGLMGSLRFSPQFTDFGTLYGSFISIGLPIDFRLKYYFTNTLDRNPIFFIADIAMSFAGYRFDLSGHNQHGFVSLSGSITFGMGMSL